MPDLDLEAIKARDALWELWGDQYARMVRLTAAERDALVAEVERLRTIEAAALDWDRADRGLEAMPCRDAAELLHRRRLAVHALRLALHPQEQTDA